MPPKLHDQRLTIFGDDDETPITDRDGLAYGSVDVNGAVLVPTFTTEPDGARPYLHHNENLPKATVDLLRGKASIGEATLKLLDKRRIAGDQDTGLLTYLLATLGGHPNLIGRRALWEEYDGDSWEPLLNGVIGGHTLDPATLVDYDVPLRDIRERARRLTLFSRADTTTVLPRGVLNGWGKPDPDAPEQEWIVPPVTPLLGHFLIEPPNPYVPGTFYSLGVFGRTWGFGIADLGDQEVPVHARVNDVIRRNLAQRFVSDTTGSHLVPSRHLRVLWRTGPGDPWKNMGDINFLRLEEYGGYDEEGEIVQGAGALYWTLTEVGVLPASGTDVEFVVQWFGPPSEEAPLHIEDTWGPFMKKVLDGVYTLDENGDPQPLGIPYDEAALLAIEEPVIARITEPVGEKDDADGRRAALDWLEGNAFQPIGGAPGLRDLTMVPIRYRLPGADEPTHTLDDSNCESAQWGHQSGDAVNFLEFKFSHHVRIDPVDDPEAEAAPTLDGIVTQPVTVRRRAPGSSVNRVGEQKLTVETALFSALSTESGPRRLRPQDLIAQTAGRLAIALSLQAFDRWVFGGQIIHALVQRSACRTWKPGDWVTVGLSWLPDYQTGRRGMSRLAQVLSFGPASRGLRAVELIDAGPDHQPFAAPTLGAFSVDPTTGEGSITVSGIPAGGEAHVQFAVSPTVPGATSALWTTLDPRLTAPGTMTTPSAPPGSSIWRRARTEGAGRRPSAWVGYDAAAVPNRGTLIRARMVLNADGTATVYWTPGRTTAGVRLRYVAHLQEDAPDWSAPDGTVDVDASIGAYTFAPGTILGGDAFSVRVEPWTGYAAGAVSGTGGEPIDVSIAVPIGDRDQAFAEVDFQLTAPTSTTILLTLTEIGTYLSRWSAWMRRGAWPTTDGTEHGPLDDRYKIVSSLEPGETIEPRWAKDQGLWYAVVVGYNEWGDAGERVGRSLDTTGLGTGGTLSNLTANGQGVGTHPLIKWDHNQVIEDAPAADYTVDIAVRSDPFFEEYTDTVTGHPAKTDLVGAVTALKGNAEDTYFTVAWKNTGWYALLEYRVTLKHLGVAVQTLYVTDYEWVNSPV